MGGGRLPQAIAAVARGEADTVVILDNDLYRRTASLLVDDLSGASPTCWRSRPLEDRVTAAGRRRAPVGARSPSRPGTFVNNEGRAQRFFAVLAPDGETREAWRWLRDLMGRLDRQEARGWTRRRRRHRRARARAAAVPRRRRGGPAARTGASPASEVARQPRRFSGRTAMDADVSVHEPAPDADPDSALAYSLEGVGPAQAPAALLPRTWSPALELGQRPPQAAGGGQRPAPQRARGRAPARPRTRRRRRRGRTRRRPAGAAPRRRRSRRGPTSSCCCRCTTSTAPTTAACTRPAWPSARRRPYIALGSADAEPARAGRGRLARALAAVDGRACALAAAAVAARGRCRPPVGLPGMPFLSLPGRGRSRLGRTAGRPGAGVRRGVGAHRRRLGPDDAQDAEAAP